MLAYTIIALAFLALVHFVVETILLPTYRVGLRYRLFAARDALRMMKATQSDSIDAEVFVCLQEAINAGVHLVRTIDFVTLRRLEKALEDNPGLRQRVERRQNLIGGVQCCRGPRRGHQCAARREGRLCGEQHSLVRLPGTDCRHCFRSPAPERGSQRPPFRSYVRP